MKIIEENLILKCKKFTKNIQMFFVRKKKSMKKEC